MISGYRRFMLVQESVALPVVEGDDIVIKRVQQWQLRGAYRQTWLSRELTAECHRFWWARQNSLIFRDSTPRDRAKFHLEKNIDCTCGIYITKNDYAGAGVHEAFNVFAHTTGWGAYIEYKDGWRVEHARIESIIVKGTTPENAISIQEDLTRVYGVPVSIVDHSSTCCSRQHTTVLYRNSRGDEVTICRLTKTELQDLLYKYLAMGHNVFADTHVEEVNDELLTRFPTVHRM